MTDMPDSELGTIDLGDFETALDVKDIGRTAAFYEGMGFRTTQGGPEARAMTMVRSDCRITLYQGFLDPPRTQLNFWHGDLDAIEARVRDRAIPFFREPKRDAEGGGAFMLMDPDDNPLFFIKQETVFQHDPKFARPATRPPPMTIDPVIGWFKLSLEVKDLARSEDFYSKLGFATVGGNPHPAVRTMLYGDCRIGLYMGFLNPPEPQLTFWQGDYFALAREIEGKGPVWDRGPSRDEASSHSAGAIWDPDGRFLYFLNEPGLIRRTD